VKAYEKDLTIPTWEIGPMQVHSVFPDAGRDIYPYTLNETLTNNKIDKVYEAVFLENQYIKVLILPEIGGRLHGAVDKTNGFEFFYWHKTIKPGLISMTGAWISGGIEWNFPHGHRPSGFMPVEHRIVRNKDGSATVWTGETEPIYRMRWLVGITVFPGRSHVRCDYVFINPTNHKNSFMFWATSATYAGDSVQAQYPGDVVTGHGKHQFWNWPIHQGVDLTWWKNSPNASSYFAFRNPSEWFGTFDHKARSGTVHVANHHTMPGKKLWTWGSGPSGRIWEDILSDGLPPYFEPQAGAWSDNQPDYHWMWPAEVKTTHDYWYPVRDIRGFHNANKDFAVNTDLREGVAFGGVYSTAVAKDYKVVLKNANSGAILHEAVTSISPDKPYTTKVKVAREVTIYDLRLAVYDAKGKLRIELQQQPPEKVELPAGLKDPGDPKKMNADELYHSGEWLDRFRRTGQGLEYYREALSKDPKDSRANAEMGFLALKQGEWNEALQYLDKVLERDSDNSRIYFGKGLAYVGLHKYKEAYDQFYRATYTYDYFSASYLNLAKIDMNWGDFAGAIEKLSDAESQNGRFADIQALKATACRHLGKHKKALAAAQKALELDPMHFMGGYEKALALENTGSPSDSWEDTWVSYMRDAVQNYLELAVAYSEAALYKEADTILARFSEGKDDSVLHPMVNYFRGHFKELSGDSSAASRFYVRASKGPAAYTNPHRLEGKAALEAAIRNNPRDAKARLFLGNLLYARGQREEGFAHWQKAVELSDALTLAWRNVAYGQRHLKKNLRASYEAYQKSIQLDPSDPRVLLELDQVAEALSTPPSERLSFLVKHLDTVNSRDDLVSRVVDLRLQVGRVDNLKLVHDVLKRRHFHSWEGRYGIHHAWVEVNKKLGDVAFEKKDFQTALRHYGQAGEYPANLEVAPRTPDFRAHVYWDLAKVHSAMGKRDVAEDYLQKILSEKYGQPHLGIFYQALAQKALGREGEYLSQLARLEKEARTRTSGGFEYRGAAATIGHYLLSLVLEEKGDKATATTERNKALEMNPRVARLSIREAQLDIARAHQ
jgi:tetratricopeptide (TPR) repeat protein